MNASREQARVLLSKARDDAFMMEELLQNPDSPPWGIGFHAQQAVEKAMKSVLSARGVEFPFTHDLQVLVNVLEDRTELVPPRADDLVRLTPFAAVLRYDAFPEDEAALHVDRELVPGLVREVIEWASGFVGKKT